MPEKWAYRKPDSLHSALEASWKDPGFQIAYVKCLKNNRPQDRRYLDAQEIKLIRSSKVPEVVRYWLEVLEQEHPFDSFKYMLQGLLFSRTTHQG